jgi:hypothetical protein
MIPIQTQYLNQQQKDQNFIYRIKWILAFIIQINLQQKNHT